MTQDGQQLFSKITEFMRNRAHSMAKYVLENAKRMTVILLTLVMLIIVGFLLSPGATYVSTMFHDTVVFVDGAYRVSCGQVPYVDFHSAFGLLVFYIPFLALESAPNFGSVLPYTLAISVIILFPFILYISVSRLQFSVGILTSVYLIFLVSSPLHLGQLPRYITTAMWYNRFSWACLILLFLMSLQPKNETRFRSQIDGFVVGALLCILFYTKISYAVVGFLFVLFIEIANRYNWRRSLMISVVLISVFVSIEFVFGFHSAYFFDIYFAIESSSAIRGGVISLLKTAMINSTEVVLVCLSILLFSSMAKISLKEITVICFIGASSLAIMSQNAGMVHIPGLVTILVLTATWAERFHTEDQRSGLRARLVFLALVTVFVFQPIVYRGTAIARHWRLADTSRPAAAVSEKFCGFTVNDRSVEEAFRSNPERIGGILERGEFEFLRLYARPHQELFQIEYVQTIHEGIELLEEMDLSAKSVVVFDMSNPFSFLMGLPPARNDCLAYHVNRLFSADHHLGAEKLLSGTDIVMIPKKAVNMVTRDALVEIYGAYVESEFDLQKETASWSVFLRQRER